MQILGILLILPNLAVLGQTPFSSSVDSLILKGMDQTLMTEFDSAAVTFQKVIDLYPDHLVGYFYQAANLQSRMMDIEDNIWENEFYRWIDTAEAKGLHMLEEGDENPWTYFYMGSVYSYKGLYQAKSGSLVQGFVSAKKGLGLLEEATKKDTSLYDAYLGLGNYKYYAGKYYKFLRWLPWISDEREEGLHMIRLAMQKGIFSNWVSINSYAWIQYDMKNYAEALTLFLKGLDHYPQSRFFTWGAALCYLKQGQFEEARKIYELLLDQILNCPWNNGYNEIEARSKLAECYLGLDEAEKALEQCRLIQKREVSKTVKDRLSDQYNATRDIEKKAKQNLASNQNEEN